MKRLEEVAREYGAAMGEDPMKPINASYDGFKAGVEFAQKWIDVYEELPENNKLVMFKDNMDDIFLGYIDNRYWYEKREYCDQDVDYVTHWRPININ